MIEYKIILNIFFLFLFQSELPEIDWVIVILWGFFLGLFVLITIIIAIFIKKRKEKPIIEFF
jgi:cytochrome c-type biogenesis protein CcmH/NrfF